jgi:hypothetical protein
MNTSSFGYEKSAGVSPSRGGRKIDKKYCLE